MSQESDEPSEQGAPQNIMKHSTDLLHFLIVDFHFEDKSKEYVNVLIHKKVLRATPGILRMTDQFAYLALYHLT